MGARPRRFDTVKTTLRAFRSRNYRLFFAGQGISLIGTWMQRVAVSWLVYRLTGSAFLLGAVSFCSLIPTFLLGPVAGVWVDRVSKRSLLILLQVLFMLQALMLAALVLSGLVETWQIIGLSLLLGSVNAFDVPARQSFVVEMVERKEDLPNAISINSMMFNGARLIGPPLAGALIAMVGEGVCFLLNGASFIAVIAGLCAMKMSHQVPKPSGESVWQQMRTGIAYAFGHRPIRTLLVMCAVISLIGMPYTVLTPIFAKDILRGGSHTLGLLMGAAGCGALTGGLFLASRRSVRGYGKLVCAAGAVLGISLIAFALSRSLWLSLLTLYCTGGGIMMISVASNSIIQTVVDDDKRGRVMSLFSMAIMGMAPFGSILGGTAAQYIGAPRTLMICGGICLAATIVYTRQLRDMLSALHDIYVEKGILPQAQA
jgi:MFS family permease